MKRAVIFDFDGTIFKSPDRNEGAKTYREATGMLFPYQGWWGRVETLSPPIVPEKPGEEWFIEETIKAYREDAKDENSKLYLMTGRPHKIRRRVIDILDSYDLKFHEYYFRGHPGSKGRDTLEIKKNLIEAHVLHPKLEILEIWEDRPEHVSEFFNLAKRWKANLHKAVIHDVTYGTHIEI